MRHIAGLAPARGPCRRCRGTRYVCNGSEEEVRERPVAPMRLDLVGESVGLLICLSHGWLGSSGLKGSSCRRAPRLHPLRISRCEQDAHRTTSDMRTVRRCRHHRIHHRLKVVHAFVAVAARDSPDSDNPVPRLSHAISRIPCDSDSTNELYGMEGSSHRSTLLIQPGIHTSVVSLHRIPGRRAARNRCGRTLLADRSPFHPDSWAALRERVTQRNPIWLIPVSTPSGACGRRPVAQAVAVGAEE